MKRAANVPPVVVLVLLLVLVASAGCRQTDAVQAANVDETVREAEPAATNAVRTGTTSLEEPSEERGASARAGAGRAVAKSGGVEARAEDGKARAGDAVAGDGEARTGSIVAGEGRRGGKVGADSLPGRVTLKVGGEPGTEFSGTCVVGGKEEDFTGRVPARFVYELDERRLECEVRRAEPSGGTLEISLRADGGSRETMVRSKGDEVSFVLTEEGTVLSTYSSGSGGSVNQQTKVTSSSNSSEASSSGFPVARSRGSARRRFLAGFGMGIP